MMQADQLATVTVSANRFETSVIVDVFNHSTTVSADRPCRTAFRCDRRLPSSEVGPVLRSALASICRVEVMGCWVRWMPGVADRSWHLAS
jgi:hypothetical protein